METIEESKQAKEKKYLIVYHAHCIDGITAAAVTTKALICAEVSSDNVVVCPMTYDDDLTELITQLQKEKIDVLYIVDFSFNKDLLYNLSNFVHSIYLYDHHASAFRAIMGEDYEVKAKSKEDFYLPNRIEPELNSNIHICLDNAECGASLCWQQLIEPSLPELIKYVKDYDLWQFKYSDTKSINKALKVVKKNVISYIALLSAFEDSNFVTRMINQGDAIIGYEDSMEDDSIEGCITPILIDGVEGLCCNAPYTLASNIGHKLALKSKTFGATWIQQSEGTVVFSLRSNGDECDVSKLAELMGGGGHKNAAGFSFLSPNYNPDTGITLWSKIEEEEDVADVAEGGEHEEETTG